MNARTGALVLGVIFILVGIAGFVPNPLVGPNGIFVTNPMHDYIHIGSGAVLVLAGLSSFAKPGLLLVGVIYAAVAALGFVMQEDMLLGLIHVNDADRYLHVGLALVLLAAGILLPGGNTTAAAQPAQ
ncbi:MAG TPA: DUF4383 domain-containing protein [Hyphomonadaceae bacterium]|nr:DUF4383 domain-containing protein [Hyphomonadaceae bacterium]